MTCSRSGFKRARPLLGTFVEIRLDGTSTENLNAAAARAFAAISFIDRLMSFHRPDSELSRLNRAAVNEWISVHPHTRHVLAAAQKLSRLSNGAFDARRETSPLPASVPALEIAGKRVRKKSAFILDLGGIAKGYAVDVAVTILKRAGVRSGLVNAGGDLRVFGEREWPIALRHPGAPGAVLPAFSLKSGAIATSGAYFSERVEDRRWNSFLKERSVTVAASTCMTADGLTKIVAIAPEAAAAILRRYRSHALVINAAGALVHVH